MAATTTSPSQNSLFSPLTNLLSLKRHKSHSQKTGLNTPDSSRRSSFSFSRSAKAPRLATKEISVPPTPPISAHPSIGEEAREETAAATAELAFHRDEAVLIEQAVERTHQSVLLLLQPKTKYEFTNEYPIPAVEGDKELLVKVSAVGLNPLDWKAPDFNFAIPSLPYISGRDLVGTVIKAPKAPNSRIKVGDVVIAISTDYRDLRKAAFQEYSLSTDFNVARLPRSISLHHGAPIGVAFVAAALGLGICFGTDFSLFPSASGPNLPSLLHSLDPETIPADVRDECLTSRETAPTGEWLAIWGGSSTTALYFSQLAKLAGFRTILIVDVGKHGGWLYTLTPKETHIYTTMWILKLLMETYGNSLMCSLCIRDRSSNKWTEADHESILTS